MHVGNGSKLFCRQTTIEGVKTSYPVIFVLDVGTHETDVRRQSIEQRTCKGTTEYGNAYVGILLRQRRHDGDEHCYIAQRGEAYYKNMFLFHFL